MGIIPLKSNMCQSGLKAPCGRKAFPERRPAEPEGISERRCRGNRAAQINHAANDDTVSAALRTASDIITRATPLKIMLMPTSVPIAQAELDGHCM